MTMLSYVFLLLNDFSIIMFQLHHMMNKYNYYLERLYDYKIV